MKKRFTGIVAIVAVLISMTACGNYGGTSDKSVTTTTSGTSITTIGPVVTTTVATVTNEPEEVLTTTASSSSEEISTTTEPTATSDVDSEETKTITTTEKETTTANTTTKKKPATVTTTTTKKTTTKTTTTTKKTTTTAKKTTTKATTTTKVKGKTMYLLDDSVGFIVGKNLDWWDRELSLVIPKGDKVTAYETVTADTPNGGELTLTKIKLSNGKTTYVPEYILDVESPFTIRITQAEVDKLIKELQVYGDQIYADTMEDRYLNMCESLKDADVVNRPTPDGWEEYKNDHLAQEHIDYWYEHMYDDPYISNGTVYPGGTWFNTSSIYLYSTTYEEAKEYLKSTLEYEYESALDQWCPIRIVLYAKWCPKGEGATNSYATEDMWDVYYFIR